MKNKLLPLLITVLCIVAAGVFALAQKTQQVHMVNGITSAPVQSVGQPTIGGKFNLINDEGQPVTEQNLIGDRYHILFFGYTNCPDVCPILLQKMANTMKQLPQSTQDKLQMTFISVDPRRDDQHTLKAFVKAYDSRFEGWTGNDADLDKMTKEYLAYYAVVPAPQPSPTLEMGDMHHPMAGMDMDDHYTVTHSSFLYIIDPKGQYVTHLPDNISETDLVAKLNDIIR